MGFLDPDKNIISHRLYRQHCTLMYNAPLALGLTPENGIVCSSWFGDDTNDEELLNLVDVLRRCCAAPSIPDFLASRYGLAAWMAQERRAFAAAMAQQQPGHGQMFGMPFATQAHARAAPTPGHVAAM